MKIKLNSIMVDDQDKALKFYTEVLGFVKKQDFPVGEYKWLTVVSAEEPNGAEIVLEPMGMEAAKVFQKALFEAGVPWTALQVDDLRAEFERMKKLGVEFRSEPTEMGPVKLAVFNDTCGNYIQMYQVNV